MHKCSSCNTQLLIFNLYLSENFGFEHQFSVKFNEYRTTRRSVNLLRQKQDQIIKQTLYCLFCGAEC